MVIRNAVLRINGREVGDWDTKVNPELARKEVVDLLRRRLKTAPCNRGRAAQV